jgi:hypothetical protein
MNVPILESFMVNRWFSPHSLLEHAENKHKKGLADCFPGVAAA